MGRFSRIGNGDDKAIVENEEKIDWLRSILNQLCYDSRLRGHKILSEEHDKMVEYVSKEIFFYLTKEDAINA